jgi:light-regulated signal transduction histidine kinase (bacteriophytochrome)
MILSQWDKRLSKMLGIKSGNNVGNFSRFESFIYEEDILHFRKAIHNALEKDIPLDTVFRIPGKKDNFRHISIKALVNRDRNGKSTKMTGVCFDITGMKKGAERAILKLNEDLIRSNRELEQFAYVASHDLQEPLRMVSSFTQLLSAKYNHKLDKDANEYIRFAVEGATRMQNLINDLLEYSRIGTRGKPPEVIDSSDILGQAITNLRVKIQESNAIITNSDLPAISADRMQFVQLFQNLLENAMKFCDQEPRIHISSVEDNAYHLFSFKDNGIGIEPAYFNKIFQIFQRLHPREDYGGTGIGLAICKRIVERHGGKIWVESNPGKGTTFSFTIPK